MHQRSRNNLPMQVVIDVEDVVHHTDYGHSNVSQFAYKYPGDSGAAKNLLSMSFTDGGTSSFVSNETREQCFCLVIAADRRLSYQLSYASQWTFLSKVMRKFHEALMSDGQRVDLLRHHFESIKEIFHGVEDL
jgi:putative ATP-dependent endonuclease of OLD family